MIFNKNKKKRGEMYKPIYINIHEYLFNIYYLDVNLKLNALFKIQLVDMQ